MCLTQALADNSLDLSEATAGSEDDENMFSLQNVINAQYLLGEHAQELQTIVVHPRVAAQLQLQGQLTFSSPAGVQPSSNLEWGGGGIGVSTPRSVSTTVFQGHCGFDAARDWQCW